MDGDEIGKGSNFDAAVFRLLNLSKLYCCSNLCLFKAEESFFFFYDLWKNILSSINSALNLVNLDEVDSGSQVTIRLRFSNLFVICNSSEQLQSKMCHILLNHIVYDNFEIVKRNTRPPLNPSHFF